MAFEEALQPFTRPSAGDLSASQYCFVVLDANGRLAISGAGSTAIGVLQNKPAAIDREARFAAGGVTKIKCGGTIAVGDGVGSDAAGKAVTGGTLGIAYEAGVVNQVISVLLKDMT
jgi:hypothetical protein